LYVGKKTCQEKGDNMNPYPTFYSSCVNWPKDQVNDLIKMIDNGRDITWKTFRKNIGFESFWELEHHLGYPCGNLKLENDYAVSFHSGKYQGKKAYWCRHSAIEYVYIME
jgi:hypothetical protein